MKLPWLSERERFWVGALVVFIFTAGVLLWMKAAEADVSGSEWIPAAPPIKHSIYVEIDGKYIDGFCRRIAKPVSADERFIGCMKRDYSITPPVCIIYGPWQEADVPEWFWTHERRKHCELGLNHP